jgi:hypothetical protein
MTEHEHERKAQEAEYELSEMEERSDRLAEQIEDTREDWHAKQRDDGVPGAVAGAAGDPDADGPPPEAQEPPGDED